MRVHPKVQQHFGNYPLERLWYLLFDYNRRHLGAAGFEKESENEAELGYMSGMFSAFNFALDSIDAPLSLAFLEELHARATNNVKVAQRYAAEDEKIVVSWNAHDSKLRKDQGSVEFGLLPRGERQNVTRAGFKELLDQIRSGDDYFCIEWDGSKINSALLHETDLEDDDLYNQVFGIVGEKKGKVEENLGGAAISIVRKGPGALNRRLTRIISRFNRVISRAVDNDAKISAIIECVHQLELSHPFNDANCRTMLVLLNKLLIQHDLTPTILTNPNRIDAFSRAELLDEVKYGQGVFMKQQMDGYEEGEGEDVLYLEGNEAVASLLVFQSGQRIEGWDRVNSSDRQHASDSMVRSICSKAPRLDVAGVGRAARHVEDRLSGAIYKKSSYQLLPKHSMFYTTVASKLAGGDVAGAMSEFRSGNQYGITLKGIDGGGDVEGGHSSASKSSAT